MKIQPLLFILAGAVLTIAGCDSGHDAQVLEDQRQFQATVQGEVAAEQWKLDDAVASRIFDDGTGAGVNRYLTFRRCHDEPPAKESNKKACEALQKRVAKAEADIEAKEAKERANW